MAATASAQTDTLRDRKVIVALTGGIACYKTATLVSRLVQRGAAVRCLMTEAATRFITPLTLQSLSGAAVVTSIWESSGGEHPESPHIGLARWGDLMVIAPCSADCLAKLANGFTDDVVTLVASALPRSAEASPAALKTPLLLAPAMNADMWANPVVQRNAATARDLLGATMIGPGEGWQACRTSGAGRMSEPEEILAAIEATFASRTAEPRR